MQAAARVLAAAVTAVAATTLLTGCSPGNWPTIALLTDGGEPAVLAEPCPDDQLAVLLVAEFGGGSEDVWPQWRAQGERPLADGEIVQLFEPPPGWRTTRSDFTELREDRTYSARAWGEQISLRVEFTLEDLRGLGPDQVWATTDGRTYRAMTRSDFERSANSDCSR